VCPIRVKGDWGESTDDEELKWQALHIQESIVPKLYESTEFQTALANIVSTQTYGTVAHAARFFRIRGEL
jgi:hypothetical protein